MLKIMEMPETERPRERLIAQGSGALSNQELLALLVGSGRQGESAMALAARVLGLDGSGLRFLAAATPEELSRIPGIGDAISCRIAAATELGRRLAMATAAGRIRCTAPEDIAALFMEDLRYETKEVFKILLLNSRGEVMGKELISVGNITGSIVDARDVYKPAIKRGAASIVLVHNHPSGDPTPSAADISATEKMVQAGDVLGIRVMDHIIIGDGRFVSFRRKKLMG
jgi:DNA repair protein RadC